MRADHAQTFPVNQIFGGGQAELGSFLVVACVCEVERAAELDQARIFDTAIFFVMRLG
jgi:hypothetical protein